MTYDAYRQLGPMVDVSSSRTWGPRITHTCVGSERTSTILTVIEGSVRPRQSAGPSQYQQSMRVLESCRHPSSGARLNDSSSWSGETRIRRFPLVGSSSQDSSTSSRKPQASESRSLFMTSQVGIERINLLVVDAPIVDQDKRRLLLGYFGSCSCLVRFTPISLTIKRPQRPLHLHYKQLLGSNWGSPRCYEITPRPRFTTIYACTD